MEEDNATTDEVHEEECCVPEAQAENEPAADDVNQDTDGELKIAQLVRTEVEKCLAQMFPAVREAPRAGTEEGELTSREFLRLGYGAPTTQN